MRERTTAIAARDMAQAASAQAAAAAAAAADDAKAKALPEALQNALQRRYDQLFHTYNRYLFRRSDDGGAAAPDFTLSSSELMPRPQSWRWCCLR